MDEQCNKWHLIRGMADWGLSMEHQICKCENPKDERDIVAYVPSIQPYCIGASMADKEYAREQANNAVLISEAPALKARVAELEVELKDSNLSLQSQQVEIGQLKAKVTDLELTIIRALGMCAVEPGFDAWHILDYLEEALAGRKEGA
jgi:hypothetical protein